MTNIYQQHDKAFSAVSAFVVLKDGEHVAKVALKFPADGAGRLYAYVHWLGTEMVRGFAGGFGYDKRSAAVADAAGKYMNVERKLADAAGEGPRPDRDSVKHAFFNTLDSDNGYSWERRLTDAGFTVLQAC